MVKYVALQEITKCILQNCQELRLVIAVEAVLMPHVEGEEMYCITYPPHVGRHSTLCLAKDLYNTKEEAKEAALKVVQEYKSSEFRRVVQDVQRCRKALEDFMNEEQE